MQLGANAIAHHRKNAVALQIVGPGDAFDPLEQIFKGVGRKGGQAQKYPFSAAQTQIGPGTLRHRAFKIDPAVFRPDSLKMLVAQLVGHQALHSQKTGNTKGIVHGFSLSPLPCGLCRIYSLLSQIFSLPAMASRPLEKLFATSRRSHSFLCSGRLYPPRKEYLLASSRHWKAQKAAGSRPPLSCTIWFIC